MTLFPAPDDSLHPRRVKVGKRAAEGFGEFEEFVILDAADAALDLGQNGTAYIPSPSLAGRREGCLADAAGDPEPADLRTDDVFGSGGHGCEPRA